MDHDNAGSVALIDTNVLERVRDLRARRAGCGRRHTICQRCGASQQ